MVALALQVLGIGQMLATIILLFSAKSFGIVKFPDLSRDTFKKIWPLPLFYLGKSEGKGKEKKYEVTKFLSLA